MPVECSCSYEPWQAAKFTPREKLRFKFIRKSCPNNKRDRKRWILQPDLTESAPNGARWDEKRLNCQACGQGRKVEPSQRLALSDNADCASGPCFSTHFHAKPDFCRWGPFARPYRDVRTFGRGWRRRALRRASLARLSISASRGEFGSPRETPGICAPERAGGFDGPSHARRAWGEGLSSLRAGARERRQ